MKALFILIFFFCNEVLAMKFIPPSSENNIDHTTPSGLLLTSKMESNSENGTLLYDKDKKNVLWKMDEFIGKRSFDLSDNGNILIVYGDPNTGMHFSTHMTDDEVLIKIFEKGKLIKEVKKLDIFSKGSFFSKVPGYKSWIKKKSVKGGDWVSLYELKEDASVDFNKRRIKFNRLKTVSF